MANVATDDRQKLIADWLGTGSINIFGRQFAGKDTQGRLLAEYLDAPLMGGGDILRSGDKIPKRALEIINKGHLLPINDYLEIVTPHLKQKKFFGKPLILSAVGRWHGEEAGVLEATAAAGHPVKAVILLNIDEKLVWERWNNSLGSSDRAGRDDESMESLQTRLEEFRNKTRPVIDFYRDEGMLIEIDASQSIEQVNQAVLDALAELAQAQQID